jgi:release factor glutamine methyltransferase
MIASFAGQTIEATRRALAVELRKRNVESAELDARLLVGAVFGLDLTGLVSAAQRIVTADEAARLKAFAQRRLAGEPIARILGVKEFWGLPLHLSVDTLVPRPDTETVVEAALELLGFARRDRALRIADLGTGSGAILLALLSELKNAYGVGTDISVAALRTASGNARELGFAGRADFVACNYASALSGAFDLIVSNPPYIRSADIATLDVEVRDHDPLRALDGGADGLAPYRVIAPEAARLLVAGGAVVVEVGHDQAADVAQIMIEAGLTPAGPPKPDLSGVERVICARKMPR